MSIDAERRQALHQAKLRALVRSRWGAAADRAVPGPFQAGAAMAAGDEAWVLAEDRPERSVGPALAWALRRGAGRVRLLTGEDAGDLARRASFFRPPPEVWPFEGAIVAAAPADPAPVPPEPPVDPRAEAWRPQLVAAGAEPVVERGRLGGEVLGLEVARVVVDGDGARLDVGVGRNDREAHRLVRAEPQGVDELRRVVTAVARHRVPGGEGHDAYHLAPERWLRRVLVARPDLVGAASLAPVSSPARRPDLRSPAPAPARGVDEEGRPLLVVCSAGVDLDLVPMAADARAADGRDPRLVICLPRQHDQRITRDLAAALAQPAEVVTVDDGWRAVWPGGAGQAVT